MKDVWLFGLALLYLSACFWPGVEGVSPPGYMYLLNPMAWMIPAWWANPLFLAGCVALSRGNIPLACGLGVVATMLASTFFFMTWPKYGLSVFQIPGVDCWLLSMVLLAAAGFVKPEKAEEMGKPARMDEV